MVNLRTESGKVTIKVARRANNPPEQPPDWQSWWVFSFRGVLFAVLEAPGGQDIW